MKKKSNTPELTKQWRQTVITYLDNTNIITFKDLLQFLAPWFAIIYQTTPENDALTYCQNLKTIAYHSLENREEVSHIITTAFQRCRSPRNHQKWQNRLEKETVSIINERFQLPKELVFDEEPLTLIMNPCIERPYSPPHITLLSSTPP